MSAAEPADAVAKLLASSMRLADAALERALPSPNEPPARLHEAMRYAVFAGGKRVRPALVWASAFATTADATGFSAAAAFWPTVPNALGERVGAAMAAVELLHTYTLVHDDLPAMDDDDLRRGRPTCHKAFDEATAILAGDALQTLAFETVAQLGAEAVIRLARATGSRGVVGGQQDDLDAENGARGADDAQRLERIHRRKTAALIAVSCELGAISAGADGERRARLAAFGEAVGLAFQIADDVLDATATAAELGKTPGKDAAQGKLTYVALYGLDAARKEAARLKDEALAALAPFGERAAPLAALARFIVERRS